MKSAEELEKEISDGISQLESKGIKFPTLEELKFPYKIENFYNFDNLEIAEFAKQFRTLDVVSDGFLTTREVRLVLKRCGESAVEQELIDVINLVDPQGKGLVNFQQFVTIANKLRSTTITEQEIIEAFKIFDRDNSGTVDAAELMQVMTSIGDKMTQEEADMMIKQADSTGIGSVDYASFAKIIMQML